MASRRLGVRQRNSGGGAWRPAFFGGSQGGFQIRRGVLSDAMPLRWLSLNWLLLLVPIAFFLRYRAGTGYEGVLFIVSALALMPLAGLMGEATENLAGRLGAGVGGLINATFGNASELIIGLIALSKGLTTIVKASLIGSILGNLLLVLGMSILVGGLRHHEQRFNRSGARVAGTSLSLASIALLVPTLFERTIRSSERVVVPESLSLVIAGLLLLSYLCTLWFNLRTHKELFGRRRADQVEWSVVRSFVVLAVSTLFIALMSEFMIGSIEQAREALHLTETFIGVIVVAIVGNAAEHSTAILTAAKNDMELSFSIAIGSSQQIALFVAPVLVFYSNLIGVPIDLRFSLPQVIAVFVAVIIVFQITGDGETNWLEGAQLLLVYLVLAALFFFIP